MTFRPETALWPVLLLAACGAGRASDSGSGDWRALLAARDGAAAEAVLRRQLDNGGSPAELAPYFGEAALLQDDLADAEYWLAGSEFASASATHGYHMLGRLRMRQGDLPAAGRAFDRALTRRADDPELWTDIARLRWQGGEHTAALAAATRALKNGPANPRALLLRAQLMRDSHGNAAALPLIERGLAAAPEDADLLFERAATLGELGRTKAMLATTRQLARVAPGDKRALYLQAVLAARAGDRELARNLLQRSGHLENSMPAAVLLLALIDMENANYASAAQGLDVLARRQPDNGRVQALLARALALGGDHRELIARFGESANTPYLAGLVGRSHEALGERDKAAPYLDRASRRGELELRPAGGAGSGAVAQVRAAVVAGRSRDAMLEAIRNLERHPGSADALSLAGDAALAAGKPKSALSFYYRAATVKRPWPLVRRMAAAMDRAGDRTSATNIVAEYLAGEPGNVDAAALLGRRLLDAGDEERSAALIERAIELGRNDPVLFRLREG